MAIALTPRLVLTDELLDGIAERADDYDQAGHFFFEDFEGLRDIGYYRAPVPAALGGSGLTLGELAALHRRIAYRSASTALASGMHLFWVGAAADRARAGDASAQWILETAAAGEIFAAGHSEPGNDLALWGSTSEARPVENGYAFYGRKLTGNKPPAPPCPVPASPRYVCDPWTPGALDGVADGSPVVVLGTGLSMLDVAISLTGAHPETVVHAVSRHALLPREHRCPPDRAVQTPILQAPDRSPVDLPGLIRQVRVAAAEAPDGWQAVIDALRPHIPGLWQRLSPPEKRLFLRHVARYWEVHRHRVPPATARRIDQLRSAGRLSLLRGRVIAVSDRPTDLCVRIEQDARVVEVAAGWLINATGPAADVTSTTDPLLHGLLDSGLARPDSLRLGIEADARGALLNVSGTASEIVFTLGPPLRGQLYETTAIPEIRDQAAALAGRLLAACRAQAAPLAGSGMAGSAA